MTPEEQGADPESEPLYAERLTPPWWIWALLAAMAVSVGVVTLVVFPPAGVLAAAVVTFAAGGAALTLGTPKIEVRRDELRAGRARIPVTLVGPPVSLDAETARHVRGPGIDPAAYHLIRGWLPRAVLVEVTDPGDLTPYWYLSTRQPEQLAAALDRARTGG